MTLRRLLQKIFHIFKPRPARRQSRHHPRYFSKRKPGRKNKPLKIEQIETTPQLQDGTRHHEPDGRGGSREGAGRKKKAPEEKTESKLITLYPDEWEELDRIAALLKVKRPKVIRRAIDALVRELKEAQKVD